VEGLERISAALRWTPKARGQATGYATSVPELVVLVAAGLSGVWEAGLWNIAASNIINMTLMFGAVALHGRWRELLLPRFRSELFFATLGIAAPIVLMQWSLDTHPLIIPALLSLFILYQWIDRKMAQSDEPPPAEAVGSLPVGLIFCSVSLVLVAVAGVFLGDSTKAVVTQMGIHPAIAGWILGLVTSLPEAVTFFAVYGNARKAGQEENVEETQEVLDNLTASNMSNTTLIYPVGLAAFLLVTQVF
jgi:Ca2+/Na+ antiporter